MRRVSSLNSFEDQSRRVAHLSELERRKLYKLDGNGPYVFLGTDEGDYAFKQKDGSDQKIMSGGEMQTLINRNGLTRHTELDDFDPTVPDFKHLDMFTFNTVSQDTRRVWEDCELEQRVTRSLLMDADELCRELDLTQLPSVDSVEYSKMIQHPNFPSMQEYLRHILPNTEIPTDLG
jgi:hypothetical protein